MFPLPSLKLPLTTSLGPPSLPRPLLLPTHSVSLLPPLLLLLLLLPPPPPPSPLALLPPLPNLPRLLKRPFHSVPVQLPLRNPPKLSRHSVRRQRLLERSRLVSHLVKPLDQRLPLVVPSVVDSARSLPSPLSQHPRPLLSHSAQAEPLEVAQRRSVVHLIKVLALAQNLLHSVSVRVVTPPRPLLLRHLVSDHQVPQQHRLRQRPHSEVNQPNPGLSVSVPAPRPLHPLLRIHSVLLRLLLPHLLRVALASTLAGQVRLKIHHLVSVIPLLLLLLLLSASDNPHLLQRPRLRLPVSRSAEPAMVLRHLLNPHSASAVLHLLRMEVRHRLVSLKGLDLEVLPPVLHRLRTVGSVWVWNQVIRLVVPVAGR